MGDDTALIGKRVFNIERRYVNLLHVRVKIRKDVKYFLRRLSHGEDRLEFVHPYYSTVLPKSLCKKVYML